uniref:Uncharacterized protein n=1 Tax=Loa loa TaxID=7209 RepID=A0A1I7VRW6_LOALO
MSVMHLKKEIELKLAKLLNRMNVIRTDLSLIMEEEESEKRITKKDEKFPALLLLNEIVGQIYKLESALNETRKLAEKEQMRMVQSELVKLEEQISSANQLLAYDVDLKDVNNPEDIGEKARNIENMEQ